MTVFTQEAYIAKADAPLTRYKGGVPIYSYFIHVFRHLGPSLPQMCDRGGVYLRAASLATNVLRLAHFHNHHACLHIPNLSPRPTLLSTYESYNAKSVRQGCIEPILHHSPSSSISFAFSCAWT